MTVIREKKVDRETMDSIDIILDFLKENPGMFSTRSRKNKPDPTTDEGRSKIKAIILKSQDQELPLKKTKTIPDPMVFHILHHHFFVEESKKVEVEKIHQQAMAVEGVIGKLLEGYIDKVTKTSGTGWVRCYGDVVKGQIL